MEVFQTENYYIFVRKEKSLWWNRTTSEFAIKAGNPFAIFIVTNVVQLSIRTVPTTTYYRDVILVLLIVLKAKWLKMGGFLRVTF